MIRKFFNYLKIYGPRRFWENAMGELRMLKRGPLQNSYSQNSEDVLIDKLLGNKQSGFYVDVGAYDPSRLSNTKRFYMRGWTGINIEPDPRKIKKFYDSRAKDINLNLGIANRNGSLTYFRFEPETLSTFSSSMAKSYQKEGFLLLETLKIPVLKLSTVLEKYCQGKQIDFMSVDVEGYDYEVLKSNNWKKFKPRLVCMESNPLTDRASVTLLTKAGYTKVCRNHNNLIFMYNSHDGN